MQFIFLFFSPLIRTLSAYTDDEMWINREVSAIFVKKKFDKQKFNRSMTPCITIVTKIMRDLLMVNLTSNGNVAKRLEALFCRHYYLREKKRRWWDIKIINNRHMNEIVQWCVLFVNEWMQNSPRWDHHEL